MNFDRRREGARGVCGRLEFAGGVAGAGFAEDFVGAVKRALEGVAGDGDVSVAGRERAELALRDGVFDRGEGSFAAEDEIDRGDRGEEHEEFHAL